MIKTIFFDFGGVLVKSPDMKKIHRWNKILKFDKHPELISIIENPNESKLIQDMCLGILPERKIWELMAEEWQIKPAIVRKLQHSMNSKANLNKPMIDFLVESQDQYQTAILSNAGDQTRRLMEDVFHLDQYVEEIIISAEEGVIKPDPAIYQIALERLSAVAETSLLIDDYQINVDAARKFGMKAVQFTDNHRTIEAVRQLLIREN